MISILSIKTILLPSFGKRAKLLIFKEFYGKITLVDLFLKKLNFLNIPSKLPEVVS